MEKEMSKSDREFVLDLLFYYDNLSVSAKEQLKTFIFLGSDVKPMIIEFKKMYSLNDKEE